MNYTQRQRQGHDLTWWLVLGMIAAVVIYGLIEKGLI